MPTENDPARRTLFETLVRDHARTLDVFVRAQLRDPGVAGDIFQETLIVAWRRLDDFDASRNFGRWLRGIAANLLRQHAAERGAARIVNDEQLVELLDAHCAELHRHRQDRLDERLEQLTHCVDALPQQYRAAIDLRYRDGVRGPALARALETTREATFKRLQRGRKMVFDCMQRKLNPAPGQA